MSRTVVRTIVAGGEGTVAVPLALALAARIAEREWPVFLTDPTQLANGIRDLVDSVNPDGVPVSSDDALLEEAAAGMGSPGPHGLASQEAARRLRLSLGDRVALVGVLPGPGRIAAATQHSGPAAAEIVQALGEGLLTAGVDVLLVCDEGEETAPLTTLANIARFHQAVALAAGEPSSGLPLANAVPLEQPVASTGVVVTDGHLERDIDFTLLEEWLDEVHG